MAKGDGFKRDWKCPKCDNYNPGWRPNCWNSACQFYREKLPDRFPAPTLDDWARVVDEEERREE